MVKVLKKKAWELTCHKCKAELRAETSDIYRWSSSDYTGDTDHYSGIRCPVCGNDCVISGFERNDKFPMWWDHSSYDGDPSAMRKRVPT